MKCRSGRSLTQNSKISASISSWRIGNSNLTSIISVQFARQVSSVIYVRRLILPSPAKVIAMVETKVVDVQRDLLPEKIHTNTHDDVSTDDNFECRRLSQNKSKIGCAQPQVNELEEWRGFRSGVSVVGAQEIQVRCHEHHLKINASAVYRSLSSAGMETLK